MMPARVHFLLDEMASARHPGEQGGAAGMMCTDVGGAAASHVMNGSARLLCCEIFSVGEGRIIFGSSQEQFRIHASLVFHGTGKW